jgi:hypothetical protein
VMKSMETISVLNQLLQTLCGSLPMYLAGTGPWVRTENAAAQSSLDNLVADQQRYAKRVAGAIAELDGNVDFVQFPVEFTAKNDLSLDFLLQEIIEAQRQDMAIIEECAAKLNSLPSLHSLAEEILGNTRGHLEILQEVVRGA